MAGNANRHLEFPGTSAKGPAKGIKTSCPTRCRTTPSGVCRLPVPAPGFGGRPPATFPGRTNPGSHAPPRRCGRPVGEGRTVQDDPLGLADTDADPVPDELHTQDG